ncbi:MAG TPA: hypothetical protein VFQ45_12140 [Longimicrobium sp.]|nr:hypothetical protein [Longimicrobium sp.]
MRKLRLNVDELRVESFDTAAGSGAGRGTVHAAQVQADCCDGCCDGCGCGCSCRGTCWGRQSCPGYHTCDISCPDSCGVSCRASDCGGCTWETGGCCTHQLPCPYDPPA